MAESPIASVWIAVLPETSRVAADIKKALRELDPEMREAGRRWGKELQDGVGDLKVPVKAETVDAKAELAKFRTEEERKKVRQRIEFDEGDAKEKLALIRKEFDGVGEKFAGGLKLNLGLAGIGLLPAAATAITDVAGSIQQLAGAGLVLPGVFAGLASSLGVAKIATLGMGDALKALDKSADGTKASVNAANAALAKLPPSTADAVETIYGLKGTFEDLQKIASANLFQGFSGGLKTLVGNDLPAVTRGIDGISRSLNQNLLQGMSSLGSGSSQGFLSRIFGNTATAQSDLTKAIDPVIHAFGTLAAAGSDSLPRLATAVGDVADRFDRFITTADGDGKLQKWIGDGLTGFKDLGDIVLNIGKSFTALTEAAGGGTGLLPMLEELTQRMSTFLNSAQGQQELVNFFHRGGQELGQLRDIAAQVGPILGGIFQAGISSANQWLPIIREVLQDINNIPGGAQGVVGAFVEWKTIQGPVALFNSLNNLSGMLGGMGGKATAAGNAMDGALRLAGPIAAAFALQQAYDGVLNKINQITGSHIATDINNRIGPDAGKWWIDEFNGNHPTQARTDAQSKLDAARKAAEAKGAPPPPASTGTPYDPFAVLGLPPPGPAPTYAPGFVGPVPAGANRPVLALPPPSSPVVVPPVSTYSAPVITEAPKGSGSGSAASNLPYSGTADPHAGTGMVAAAASASGLSQQDSVALAIIQEGMKRGLNRDQIIAGLDVAKLESAYGSNPASRVQQNQSGTIVQGIFQQDQGYSGDHNDPHNAAAQFFDRYIQRGGLNNDPYAAAVKVQVGAYGPGYVQSQNQGGTYDRLVGLAGSSPMDPLYSSSALTPSGTPGGATSGSLALRNSQERVDDTQHSVDDAQARMDAVNAKGTASAKERADAEYAVGKATREHQDALDALTVAQNKYNEASTKGGGGKDSLGGLGQSVGGDLWEMLGIPGVTNPADMGITKFLGGLLSGGLGINLMGSGGGASGGGGAGSGSLIPGGGGGGGIGGLLGLVQNFMPGAPATSGMPGMPQSNSANILDAVQFKPPGGTGSPGPGNVIDNGIHLEGASFGDSHQVLSSQISEMNASKNRYGPLSQNFAT